MASKQLSPKENYKYKHDGRKCEAEVAAGWLVFFNPAGFSEGMTAVKANQPFLETRQVPHLLHGPDRYVPICLSRGNAPKSCQTYILLDLHWVIFSDAEHLP